MISEDEQKFFIVDWVLPAANLSDLHAAHRALDEAGRRLREHGEPVRCVRSTYVPARGRWLCLFTAANATVVRKVHEIAQIPVSTIDEAIDLAADQGQPA